MTRDIHITARDLEQVQLQARQLRAEVLAGGLRHMRDWTASAIGLRGR